MKIQVVRGLLRLSLRSMFTLLLNKISGHSRQNPLQEVKLPTIEETTLYTWV